MRSSFCSVNPGWRGRHIQNDATASDSISWEYLGGAFLRRADSII